MARWCRMKPGPARSVIGAAAHARREGNPWSGLPAEPPYVALEDLGLLSPEVVRRGDLRLDELPVPWIGDPCGARVLLLGLNPGWVAETPALERGVYAEENRLGLTFRSRVPFWGLDPRLSGTPGHKWWSQRLRRLTEQVGLQRVVAGIACVEWFPYHSPTFRRLPFLSPSQRYSFQLVASALDRGVEVVVMRSYSYWLESVPQLARAAVLQVKVPRSPYLTPANLPAGGFDKLCAALADLKLA